MPASRLPSWQEPRPSGPVAGKGEQQDQGGWSGMPWPAGGPPAEDVGGPAPAGAPGPRRAGARGPGPRGDGVRDEGPGFPAGAAWWAVPGALVGIVLAGLGAGIGYGLTNSKTSAASDLLGEAGLWVAMLGTAVFVSHRYGSASLVRHDAVNATAKVLCSGEWGEKE